MHLNISELALAIQCENNKIKKENGQMHACCQGRDKQLVIKTIIIIVDYIGLYYQVSEGVTRNAASSLP